MSLSIINPMFPQNSGIIIRQNADEKENAAKNCHTNSKFCIKLNVQITEDLQYISLPFRESLKANLNWRQVTALEEVQKKQLESLTVSKIKFFIERPGKLNKQLVAIGKLQVVGAAIGAFAGPEGAVAGAAVAGCCGLFAIGRRIVRLNTREFQEYREVRQEMLREGFIENFVKEDDELRHFLCPITHTLPEIPVTFSSPANPYNFHYDYQAIDTMLKEKPETVPPGCLTSFNHEDLTLDFPCMRAILNRFAQLTQACLERDPIVQIGQISTLPINLKEMVVEYYGIDEYKTNNILIRMIDLRSRIIRNRDVELKRRIQNLYAQRDQGIISDKVLGEKLSDLKYKYMFIKKAVCDTPNFIYRLFGVKPKLTEFRVQIIDYDETYSEQNYLYAQNMLQSLVNKKLKRAVISVE